MLLQCKNVLFPLCTWSNHIYTFASKCILMVVISTIIQVCPAKSLTTDYNNNWRFCVTGNTANPFGATKRFPCVYQTKQDRYVRNPFATRKCNVRFWRLCYIFYATSVNSHRSACSMGNFEILTETSSCHFWDIQIKNI